MDPLEQHAATRRSEGGCPSELPVWLSRTCLIRRRGRPRLEDRHAVTLALIGTVYRIAPG
jgi:hypothetical protein